MSFEAKVIAHSRPSWVGDQSPWLDLITVQMRAPKFIDAEIEKHGMIRTNSSSDRAIPYTKMLSQGPYIPEQVYKNQSGMHGTELIDDDHLTEFQTDLKLLYASIVYFMRQYDYVHKQHLNRYLLPFSWQSKVATATYDWWQAFIKLRTAEAAQPEIRVLAMLIDDAIRSSEAVVLRPGEWHLPYIVDDEMYLTGSLMETYDAPKVSAARCARVSYNNHDGSKADIVKDLKLAGDLHRNQHWSCFEHQARVMEWPTDSPPYDEPWEYGVTHMDGEGDLWSGPFRGWVQYRKLLGG